ncbi:hypothetical protein RG959_05300 [Domibacillus sp. 8LH]
MRRVKLNCSQYETTTKLITQADIDRGYVEVVLTDKSLGERLLGGLL